jgi:protein-L-isoaspartate(D-aspartate) O-methyltransferase
MASNPRAARMVAEQLKPHGIWDEKVLAVMAELPREAFVPPKQARHAYEDHPLGIGGGQTISQPLVVAAMTQAAAPRPDEVALEVGSGSGYQAAVLARLCRKVVAVERDSALAAWGAANLRRAGIANVEVHHGDGFLGWPPDEPYDVIVVSAAAPHLPSPLVEQLAEGGRLVIPLVQSPEQPQELVLFTKRAGRLERTVLFPVLFVPLTEGLNS